MKSMKKKKQEIKEEIRRELVKKASTSKGIGVCIACAAFIIITATGYLLFKLGQKSKVDKWNDYDDCGWA